MLLAVAARPASAAEQASERAGRVRARVESVLVVSCLLVLSYDLAIFLAS